MQVKTFITVLVTSLLAGEAVAAITPLIATDPVSACQCPRNCSHKSGSKCKYYSGPSSDTSVLSGKCAYRDGLGLVCIAGN
ncbi:antifungsal 2 [Fusarium beomiforme]|uniref:Antifungsal 2 n=1 Tax=Fusarium beomiforme TaxID=44412 RepID=A0A9P5DS87_9HYPO|nr:antifungsal 2 [Fusarium beomiforme]